MLQNNSSCMVHQYPTATSTNRRCFFFFLQSPQRIKLQLQANSTSLATCFFQSLRCNAFTKRAPHVFAVSHCAGPAQSGPKASCHLISRQRMSSGVVASVSCTSTTLPSSSKQTGVSFALSSATCFFLKSCSVYRRSSVRSSSSAGLR